jgi:predicted MFS family arabinose efflux permease
MTPSQEAPWLSDTTRLLAAIGFTVFVVLTALSMLGPLLIDMSQDWTTTVPVVAQLVTAAAVAWAITALVVGPFSDAYGRKPILLTGVLLISLASVGTALAPNLETAAVFRMLAGVGGGMVPPTCIALIGDIVPVERRAMGVAVVTTQPGLSSVVGVPLVTLLAASAGWRAAFFAVGGVLLLCAVVLLIYTPQRQGQRKPLVLGTRLKQVGRFSVTWLLAFTNLTVRTAYGLIMTFFPSFLQVTYGLSTAELALPISIVAVGTTCGLFLGGKIGRSPHRLSLVAITILIATLPGLAVFTVRDQLWLTVAVTSVFMVLVMPLATLLFVVGTEIGGTARGTLTGILSGSGYVSYAVGAGIGGLAVANIGYSALSFALVASTIGSSLLLTFFIRTKAEDRAREYFQ